MAKENKGGRPSKLTEDVLSVFSRVVEDNILYCTDEELFFLLNDELTPEQQVSYRTFQRWKAGELTDKNGVFDVFCRLIKKALIKERRSLLENLKTEEKTWQKWAWIIERKFDEWNIKQKIESKGQISGPDGKPIQTENKHTVVFEDYKKDDPAAL